MADASYDVAFQSRWSVRPIFGTSYFRFRPFVEIVHINCGSLCKYSWNTKTYTYTHVTHDTT